MAVKIRLARHGAKGAPFYRIVVADSRSPRDGRFIDRIGTYNPRTQPSDIQVDEEKARGVAGKGAQPTDQVAQAPEGLRRSLGRRASGGPAAGTWCSSWRAPSLMIRITSRSRAPRRTRGWTSSSGWPRTTWERSSAARGASIRAIRTVAKAASVKPGKRVNVEVPG